MIDAIVAGFEKVGDVAARILEAIAPALLLVGCCAIVGCLVSLLAAIVVLLVTRG